MTRRGAFYFLHLVDSEETGLAHGEYDRARDAQIAAPGPLSGWVTLRLELQRPPLTDYLANDVGLRLCSRRLREVIDGTASSVDTVEWLPVTVADADDNTHPYSALRFAAYPDVLSSRTMRAGEGFVVKPVLDRKRAEGHHVFAFEGATTRLIVSNELRSRVIERGCTGVDFSAVPIDE